MKLPRIGHIVLGILACLLCIGAFSQETELDRIALSLRNLSSVQLERPDKSDLACAYDLFQFKIRKVQFLLQFYKPSKEVLEAADAELRKAEALLKSVQSKSPMQIKTGTDEEAYIDDIDGTPQPYIRYLPANYDKKNKYPLIIYLHGYSPYLNIVNWTELPEGLAELAEKVNACVVMPFARGNTDFQGIGEKDVLNVIEIMKKRYSIDEDRIILNGMSMGGMGVWTIGSHYPHLFAGLLVVSGRGDFYFWHKLERGVFPAWKQYMIDREFGVSHLANLRQLPVWVFHGTDDKLINVAEARHMNELLSAGNPLFRYKEIEGGDHWIHEKVYGNEDVADWIRTVKRRNPESFEFVSYSQEYSRAYWLFISTFERNCQPAKIQAEVKEGKVLVQATGASKLVLDRSLMPDRIKKFPVEKSGNFALEEVSGYRKKVSCNPWGPVKEAFLEPFIFVNAGMEDSEFRQRILGWYLFVKSIPRFKKEEELTENDRLDYNLFLYGEPETSPLIVEALKSTPVRITADEIAVGDRSFPRKDKGLYLRCKSPWNPERSVVIQCGILWSKSCSENHRYDFLPGYSVYSAETDPDDPFGCSRIIEGGFFGYDGKITP